MQTTKAVASLQAEVAQLRHELQTVKGGVGSDDSMFVGQYLIERLVQLGVTVSAALVAPLSSPKADRAAFPSRKCLASPETSTSVSDAYCTRAISS